MEGRTEGENGPSRFDGGVASALQVRVRVRTSGTLFLSQAQAPTHTMSRWCQWRGHDGGRPFERNEGIYRSSGSLEPVNFVLWANKTSARPPRAAMT